MNILFIRDYPLVDGTFTLLLRLSRQMKEDGNHPYFLFFSKPDANLMQDISGFATVLEYEKFPSMQAAGQLPGIDVIHGILAGEVLYKTYVAIKKKYFPDAAMVIGVYHPRAFFTQTRIGSSPDTWMHWKLFRQIPARNLLFMNDTVRACHEKYFKHAFKESAIIPIPVTVPANLPVRGGMNRNKIVSIGRLVEFKNYITPVIRLITQLNQKGYAFEYHIYGGGPLRGQIETLIANLQAGSFIHLHDYLPYTEFKKTVADALIFIGMGTSIIESSAESIPSLLAVESRNEYTYGWFFNTPGYEVGEQVEGQPELLYEAFILEAFNANATEYAKMCRKSWEKAKTFSIDAVMPAYYSFIQNADKHFSFNVPGWKRYLLKWLRQPYKLNFLIKKGHRHR